MYTFFEITNKKKHYFWREGGGGENNEAQCRASLRQFLASMVTDIVLQQKKDVKKVFKK